MRHTYIFFCLMLIGSGALLASAVKSSKKTVPKSSFLHEGVKWTTYQNEEGKAFYHNSESGKVQWNDPRIAPLTANQRTLAFLVFFIPVVLMVAGAAGYIYWIKRTRPELFKGPKKVKGLKNWERALLPPKTKKSKDQALRTGPLPEDATKSD